MSIEIKTEVTGFDRVFKLINNVEYNLKEGLTMEELTIIGERILELAQESSPFRTGALRASLQIYVDKNNLSVSVGTDIGYGKFVELGTTKMSARPFLVPALFVALQEFKQRYPNRLKEMSRVNVSL